MAHDVELREIRIESRPIGCRELHLFGTQEVIKVRRVRRTGDWYDVFAPREYPAEHEWYRRCAGSLCPVGDEFDKRHVVFDGFRRELRQCCATVRRFKSRLRVDGPERKREAKRTVRYEAYAEFLERSKNLGFRLPLPDAVFGLQGC